MFQLRLRMYVGCALAVMFGLGGTTALAEGKDSPCGSLASIALSGLALKVASVEIVPAGPMKGRPGTPSTDLPEHCLWRAEINPRTGVDGKHYGIGFELRLPTTWNGKFYFQGGGGMDGAVRPAIGAMPNNNSSATVALARGYAVASTDAGHESMDGAFGADQQARIDYYYNAIDQVTQVAQRVLPMYYGQPLKRSYFAGCSNGGRQALIAAQRFPLMFDGVISGDPAFNLTNAAVSEVWEDNVYARIAPRDAAGQPILSKAFSNTDLKLVSGAVVQKCDALDGAKDGLIENPMACHFDPAVLACKGAKSDSCLSAEQVSALKEAFGGPKTSDGKAIYSDWPYDGGIADFGWRIWKLGSSETAQSNALNMTLGLEATKSIHMNVYHATFDRTKFNFDTAVQDMAQAAAFENATYPAMTSFAGHGGKLILFTGMSDPIFSANDLIRYFRQLQIDNGGAASADKWASLFLIPGMTHCGGGPALNDFDPLTALEAWVENGDAPKAIPAKGKSFPGRTRNLCPAPQYPHYKGSGSVDDAQNFECKVDAQ